MNGNGEEDGDDQSMQIEWEEDHLLGRSVIKGHGRIKPGWDKFLPEAAIENGAQGVLRDHYTGPQGELA